MEAVRAPSPAADHPVLNKQRKRPSRKNNNPRSSVPPRTMENVGPAIHGNPLAAGSLLFAPPPLPPHMMNPPPNSLYFSYPPSSLHHQPPLLPLPIPVPNKPRFYSLPNYNSNNIVNVPFPPTRGGPSSSPPKPATKKTNHSLTPKKPSKRVSKPEPNAAVSPGAFPLGPDPSDLPKGVPMALSSPPPPPPSYADFKVVREDRVLAGGTDKVGWLSSFDDELMTISSPPASSLPLPRFCLRPKKKLLSMISTCTAEVAAVAEDGATDNLRHLLRLR